MTASLFFGARLLAPRRSATGRVQRVGFWLLGAIVLAALAAPLLTPYGPKDYVCPAFAVPSSAHWLGCDDAGRDLFTQLFYGARRS